MVAMIGRAVLSGAQSTTDFLRLVSETLAETLRPPVRVKETIQQMRGLKDVGADGAFVGLPLWQTPTPVDTATITAHIRPGTLHSTTT